MPGGEWSTEEHAFRYLARADSYPRRAEGEAELQRVVPLGSRRILDLGTGNGRLLDLLLPGRPDARGVGLDISEPMLEAANERFEGEERVSLLEHDLAEPLPDLGHFDAVVSSFAIHHLEHERKRSLFAEIADLLEPGGVFANLEHVASPTRRLHLAFYAAIGEPLEDEDPSDKLLGVETQLGWLRDLGLGGCGLLLEVARDGAARGREAALTKGGYGYRSPLSPRTKMAVTGQFPAASSTRSTGAPSGSTTLALSSSSSSNTSGALSTQSPDPMQSARSTSM
jgi:tRNA (cmo5U34)-methyltransferase